MRTIEGVANGSEAVVAASTIVSFSSSCLSKGRMRATTRTLMVGWARGAGKNGVNGWSIQQALQTCRRIEETRKEESKTPSWAGRVGIGFGRASLLLTDVKLQEPFETSRFFPTPKRCQQHVVSRRPRNRFALALASCPLLLVHARPTLLATSILHFDAVCTVCLY